MTSPITYSEASEIPFPDGTIGLGDDEYAAAIEAASDGGQS